MTVPNLVVVFLCVIAAGALVIVGAAFGKQFLPSNRRDENDEEVRDWTQMPPEQVAYCRSVRERNQMAIIAQVRHDMAQEHGQAGYEVSSGHGPFATNRLNPYVQGRYATEHAPGEEWSEHGR